ncbi:DUF2231 domain-containing protein [Longispora sp. NPDC051575]|uniref:DUF2231 domain-containing protein n=1 Tax=Longispora sp. NPDC051575 TaxID=3154943 RepID=UPI00342421B5
MFDEIMGLPAHPLLVHAAVVFVPLLALMGVVYVLVPPLRARFTWVFLLLAVIAPVVSWVAKESGERFERRMQAKGMMPPELAADINVHQDHGEKMLWFVCGLAVVSLLFMALDAGRRRANANVGPAPAGGEVAAPPAARGRMIMMIVFGLAVLVLAGFSGWYVYKTGDAGARIAWSGY